jgi:pimeloyl-ACP methyl ester carboxylesterase
MLAKNPISDLSFLWGKIAQVFQGRSQAAFDHFYKQAAKSLNQRLTGPLESFSNPWQWAGEYWEYAVDFTQRSVLVWDTLRQRGDNFLDHEKAGKPPVLHFDFETVLDARQFKRPVNYALVRIIPPPGVMVDPNRRPYLIIDPRAGHGPGIGGFKDDSQVGVALRDGHPVYFVIFFPEPEPGQTLLDVCDAEAAFLRRVRELHPDSAKPVIIGNCQGGWAVMMLAAANPDETGPIVLNGAPLSYWGGAWRNGEGDNPMRYAGGLLGGTWLSSFTSDLGDGKFDGANLVANMEYLNPANTFWNKYYHLFANVDTEAPRFLEFERWWGGFYLMNRGEIDWITQNLFVGNRLWDTDRAHRGLFDLRQIKVPIILFASLGDNITPPQQAFNWVADVYESTEDIKARGQTIVGLLHEDIGHLGIFVSGRVAKKEYTQIVSVLKSIEALPPGLYGMKILEKPGPDGHPQYTVEFVEHRLEEVATRLNRFERVDEKPFEAAAMLSDFNQRAYDLFVSPAVKALARPESAKFQQLFHPLRVQRWMWSSQNPWVSWLKPAAAAVRQQRRTVAADQPLRRAEQRGSALLSALFDLHRDIRDAINEATFFGIYGSLFSIYLSDRAAPTFDKAESTEGKQSEVIKSVLSKIGAGGYPEALARAGALLERQGEPLRLTRLELKQDLLSEYKQFLPDLPAEIARRIQGEQDVIVSFEREAAIESMPQLLGNPQDRQRLLTLLERLAADARVQAEGISPEQLDTLNRIRRAIARESAGTKGKRAANVAVPAAKEGDAQ